MGLSKRNSLFDNSAYAFNQVKKGSDPDVIFVMIVDVCTSEKTMTEMESKIKEMLDYAKSY